MNPLQELKGNIRVFCRVRPSLQSEVEGEGSGTEPLATSFPTSGERRSNAFPARAVEGPRNASAAA
jgi:hypothetical protein